MASLTFQILTKQSSLPDYESYELMFQERFDISSLNQYSLIIGVFDFMELIGLNYESARFLFSFGLTCLFLIFLSKRRGLIFYSHMRKYRLVIPFALLFFILEFFHVRLRAGLSLFIFLIGLIQSSKYFRNGFILLSIVSHFGTGLICSFLFSSFLFNSHNWSILKKYNFPIKVIFSLCLFYFLEKSITLFRADFISTLNPFRFYVTYFFLVVYVAWKYLNNYKTIGIKIEGNESLIALYLGLTFVYFFGLTEKSGEAIVRITTLSSFLAIYVLHIAKYQTNINLSLYMLLTNGMFFLYTLEWI